MRNRAVGSFEKSRVLACLLSVFLSRRDDIISTRALVIFGSFDTCPHSLTRQHGIKKKVEIGGFVWKKSNDAL